MIEFLYKLFYRYVEVLTLGRNKHPSSELIVLTVVSLDLISLNLVKILSKDLGKLPFKKSWTKRKQINLIMNF